MWPRAVEVMFGVWLLFSPFVFRHPLEATGRWANDLVCGALVVTLALLSFWRRTRRAHLGLIAVSAWLVAYGYFAGGHPSAPSYQNAMLVGLTLVLFNIMPNDVNLPPRRWREHYAERARTHR